MHIIIGFGSNLYFGKFSPLEILSQSIQSIKKKKISVKRLSSLYQSAPVPPSGQPDFLNAAIKVETTLSPEDLMAELHDIEREFGRRRADRWEARTLDLDLLIYGDRVTPSLDYWRRIADHPDPAAIPESVMVPHPRLHKRLFALQPLLDILPDFHHPVLQQSAKKLLEKLEGQALTKKEWPVDGLLNNNYVLNNAESGFTAEKG